jgi:hypothetical protein
MQLNRLTKPERVAAACMLVVALAAFLPWVSIFGLGIVGIRGDGKVTLFCAIVGLVLLALGTRSDDLPQKRILRVVAYIAAVVAALVGFGDMNGAAAIGLYLTLFGSIGWIIALVWNGIERKKLAAASAATARHEDVQEPPTAPVA